MAFMDAGINAAVGPPVYGVNLVECTREIQTTMTGILGGRPSEEVTSTVVVALFRVKSHVQNLLLQKDPVSGATSCACARALYSCDFDPRALFSRF